ncbi:MAG: D-ribose pyranase, partial [Planococcus donghaensis]
MKKHGMINRDIAAALAQFGHTDLLVIADCGLPIPKGIPCVDLSYKIGEPAFLTILDAVLADFEAEGAYIAQEIAGKNPIIGQEIFKRIKADFVTHEELKDWSKQAKLIIRTGEATPYA